VLDQWQSHALLVMIDAEPAGTVVPAGVDNGSASRRLRAGLS
jgi:hypothetical protein